MRYALCAVALLGAGTVRAAVDIALHDEVRIDARVYSLGDIAAVAADEAGLAARLAGVRIGRTPRAGVVAQVERADVAARIERVLPGRSASVHWSGADRTRVRSLEQPYVSARYVAAARDAIHDWLAARFDRFSTEPAGDYRDLRLPLGAVRLEAGLAPNAKVGKRLCVWVDLFVDNVRYRTLPVWFAVSAQAPVWVLDRPLRAGATVVPAMLRAARRDIAGLGAEPVADVAHLRGQRLTRDVAADTVLTGALLEPVPDVVRGQRVEVRAGAAGVTLTVAARALADGNRGDPIRVERLDGNASYRVRVVAAGVAVVEGDSDARANP